MLDKETKEVAERIGIFFLRENDNDYTETRKQIEQLRINDIIVLIDRIIICTSRPGLLIGRRGTQIEKLKKFLGKSIHIKETTETLLDYLVPYEPEPCDLDWRPGIERGELCP